MPRNHRIKETIEKTKFLVFFLLVIIYCYGFLFRNTCLERLLKVKPKKPKATELKLDLQKCISGGSLRGHHVAQQFVQGRHAYWFIFHYLSVDETVIRENSGRGFFPAGKVEVHYAPKNNRIAFSY